MIPLNSCRTLFFMLILYYFCLVPACARSDSLVQAWKTNIDARNAAELNCMQCILSYCANVFYFINKIKNRRASWDAKGRSGIGGDYNINVKLQKRATNPKANSRTSRIEQKELQNGRMPCAENNYQRRHRET